MLELSCENATVGKNGLKEPRRRGYVALALHVYRNSYCNSLSGFFQQVDGIQEAWLFEIVQTNNTLIKYKTIWKLVSALINYETA